MSTMTEMEVMNSTSTLVENWFHNESNILESLYNKEEELYTLYGEGNYMCPYYTAFVALALVNHAKGWTKEELINDLSEILPDQCIPDGTETTVKMFELQVKIVIVLLWIGIIGNFFLLFT